jgi:hypothetical protein
MHLRRLGLGALVGFAVACGGSEFTSGAPDGGAGGASTTGSSTGTSAATGTVTGTTGSTTAATTTGAGGNATTGTSGSSGPGTTGPGSATTGGGSGGSGSGGAGGTTSSGSAGKGGASGSAGASGSTGSGGGGRGGAGGSSGAGGSGGVRDAGVDTGVVDCTVLRKDLDQKLAAAQVCDPKSMTVQCQDMVESVCCAKVPVTSGTSAETMAYLDALAKFKAAKCVAVCTLALCPTGPTSCQANPDVMGGGKCAFGLLPPGP